MNGLNRIAVVGAGTMGQGIAQASAQAGFEVLLYDVSAVFITNGINAIQKNLSNAEEKNKISAQQHEATLSRITTTTNLNTLQADLIIEAVVEQLDVKKNLFEQLEAINNADCILASNTSSFSITQIAEGLKIKQRFIGMHFFNPAHIMKLVEIIEGEHTSPLVTARLRDFVKRLNKISVLVKDSPGFIVNRVARHYYLEALRLMEEGISNPEAIDKLLRSAGFKMGPFELMDLIGMDVNLAVTKSIYEAFNKEPRFRPNNIQEKKVNAGELGKKSGKGFYEY